MIADRYRLERKVGGGRVSAMWRVQDQVTAGACAIKLLHRSMNDHPEALARFSLEDRLSRELTGAYFPERVGSGSWHSLRYIAWRWYDGDCLRSLFDRNPKQDVHTVYSIVQETCQALSAVHGAGYTQNVHEQFPYYFREQMFHNLLNEKGFVVLDMDYRASEGYGRDWRTAIYRQMGTPELEDLVDGVHWLEKNYSVDANRVGLYGGSYGGFMTLMAMFRAPDVFKAGGALRPVTDWTQYNHEYTSNILNDPAIDPIAYERSSPIEFADGLKGHLLIAHGMIDDNVLFEDSARLYQKLVELHKDDFEIAPYPMERHGFVHADSWLDEYKRIDKLFESTLK